MEPTPGEPPGTSAASRSRARCSRVRDWPEHAARRIFHCFYDAMSVSEDRTFLSGERTMNIVPPIRVKICCVQSEDEAATAVAFGAAAVGLVTGMPSGPPGLDVDSIRSIVAAVPPGTGTFLLTSATDVDRLTELAAHTGVNTLQLWDRLPREDYGRLRSRLPGVALVQAVHVVDDSAVDEAMEIAPRVDAIVLDSGNAAVPFRWEPATGRIHDWNISRRVVEALDRPVFLAGGITAVNVAAAVQTVRPYGIDVCTGVRTDDQLDVSKLSHLFESLARVSPVRAP